MSEDKYIKNISGNKLFRFMAWVALVIIVGLVIATIITGLTGSRYFLGFLVLSMITPVFVYAVLIIGRVLYNATHDGNSKEEMTEDKKINN